MKVGVKKALSDQIHTAQVLDLVSYEVLPLLTGAEGTEHSASLTPASKIHITKITLIMLLLMLYLVARCSVYISMLCSEPTE